MEPIFQFLKNLKAWQWWFFAGIALCAAGGGATFLLGFEWSEHLLTAAFVGGFILLLFSGVIYMQTRKLDVELRKEKIEHGLVTSDDQDKTIIQ